MISVQLVLRPGLPEQSRMTHCYEGLDFVSQQLLMSSLLFSLQLLLGYKLVNMVALHMKLFSWSFALCIMCMASHQAKPSCIDILWHACSRCQHEMLKDSWIDALWLMLAA